MIEPIESAPDGVLAFKAVGEVTKEDYESVLEPAIQATIEDRGKVRFVYVLGPDFTGYSAAAAWEDTKLGMGEIKAWERCAIVTSHDWIAHLSKAFGWTMPGHLRVFAMDELGDAMTWAAGD